MEHSENISKLAAALAAFQAEVNDPSRDGQNPHFRSKYVQIDGLLAAVRPMLSKHGLSVVQSIGGDGQNISVTTEIMHTSGEWIRTDALVMKAVKQDPQGAGSCATYGRRYGLSAALGVAWDDDDDGEAASTPKLKAKSKAGSLRAIAAAAKELGATPDDLKEVMRRHYNKASSNELTDAEAADMEKNFVSYVAEVKDDDAKLMDI